MTWHEWRAKRGRSTVALLDTHDVMGDYGGLFGYYRSHAQRNWSALWYKPERGRYADENYGYLHSVPPEPRRRG